MWPDRVSNPGHLTHESGALPTAQRGPACTLQQEGPNICLICLHFLRFHFFLLLYERYFNNTNAWNQIQNCLLVTPPKTIVRQILKLGKLDPGPYKRS